MPGLSSAPRRLTRAGLLVLLLVTSSIAWPGWLPMQPAADAQTADVGVVGGRLLGATRFQLAWLDWNAPRPVFLTALATPSVAHDVAALPGISTALLAVSTPGDASRTWGADPSALFGVDLSTPAGQRVQPQPLLMRADPSESLSWPAWWPDGSAFVFQREDDAAAGITTPAGFTRPPARIELAQADGSERRVLADPGWQPSPAPDGSAVAFVRFDARGASLLTVSTADLSDHTVVDADQFPEIFSPRYSPDGQTIAFGARSFADIQPAPPSPPTNGLAGLLTEIGPSVVYAHGTLADLWLVNADGSNLHQISTLRVHDPALAWSSDGSQVFAYGEWGAVLVDLPSGEDTLMTYLTGTTAVAWLP